MRSALPVRSVLLVCFSTLEVCPVCKDLVLVPGLELREPVVEAAVVVVELVVADGLGDLP